jgi:uncharacterized protein (DUF362 family)/ferredoxin
VALQKILVGDSNGFNDRVAAKVSGIYDATIESGAEWVNFEQIVEITCPDGKTVKSVFVTETVNQVDIIVTLPKLKTHRLMAYTGAMKNNFGLMVGRTKSAIHHRFPNKKDFAAYLTDLNIAIKPHYGIMDGILAMSGDDGPTNGIPTQVGILAASCNVLALDWMCATLVGFEPDGIVNLADALSRRFWLNSPEEIELKGDDFDRLKPNNFSLPKYVRSSSLFSTHHKTTGLKALLLFCLKKLKEHIPAFYKIIRYFIGVYPHFQKTKCTFCKNCIKICPAKALVFTRKKKILLKRSKCIRCFCCHEMCLNNAIVIKRGL